jgi:hypothetical protein
MHCITRIIETYLNILSTWWMIPRWSERYARPQTLVQKPDHKKWNLSVLGNPDLRILAWRGVAKKFCEEFEYSCAGVRCAIWKHGNMDILPNCSIHFIRPSYWKQAIVTVEVKKNMLQKKRTTQKKVGARSVKFSKIRKVCNKVRARKTLPSFTKVFPTLTA